MSCHRPSEIETSATMKVVLFISVWVISVVAYDKAPSRDCGTDLSSVRMEVSPTLLHVICSNNNQTTLVVDCGSNIWYEKVTGFCNSFDLNIGQVFMTQPLLSSTVTLQLVKSGQVLDAARVAILTSEHLFHYRISVWGNRNTRFVLAIERGCTPSQHNDMAGVPERHLPPAVVKSSRHFPLVHVNSQLPAPHYNTDTGLSQLYPYYVRDEEVRGVPEYLRPNKLANFEDDNYAFLKMPKLQPVIRDTSRFGDKQTKMEIYRSKVSKPDSGVGVDHLHQYDEDYGEDDVMTTTPESSEIAKLRWMEEKRILFEQRMKFLRNFYPENGDTTENEGQSVDDVDDKTEVGTGNLKEIANNLPTRLDSHRGVNEPSSSADSIRQAEDAQNVPETGPGDHDREQTRRSDNLQLSRKNTRSEEHTKLEYRQLSSSVASLNRNINEKIQFIQSLYPSDKSVSTTAILSSAQAEEPFLNKNYTKFTNEKNNYKQFNVVDTTKSSNSSLQAFQKLNIGDTLLSVLKKPLDENRIPVNNVERFSDFDKDVSSRSFQSSATSINVSDIIYANKFTQSNYDSQRTTKTTIDDRFIQSPSNPHSNNAYKDGADSSKPTTVIDNGIPSMSVTLRNFLQKVTSQLKSEFQQNLRSSTENARTEVSVRDTSTAPSISLFTSTQLRMEPSKFVLSSTTDKINNSILHVTTDNNRQKNELFTSTRMNLLYSSTDKQEKIKDNISTASVVSTPHTEIPTSAHDRQNDPDPVTLTTSQSFAHSAPLEMKSASSRQPPIHYEVSDIVDKTVSSVPTRAQPRLAEQQGITEAANSAVTKSPQRKANDTHLLQKTKAKTIQQKDMIQPFLLLSNNTTQASTSSSHIITQIPSVVLKRESHVSPNVLENSSTEASVKPDIIVTEQTKTTASFEQDTTSPFQTNTGTSQGGENELQEMRDDSFWPVVAALVIGIPAIVVLVIAITVIHKKRLDDPARQACLQIIHATANA